MFVDGSLQVLVQVDDTDADYLHVHFSVQGVQLGPARLSKSWAHEFEHLLQLALCFVDCDLVEPIDMSRPVSLAIFVEHTQGDDYTMVMRVQGQEIGPRSIEKEDLEDLQLLVEQSILRVAEQNAGFARA